MHNWVSAACFASGDPSKYLLPHEALDAFADHCKERIGDSYFRPPRTSVKAFVDLLSVLEQNPAADWKAVVGACIPPSRPQNCVRKRFGEKRMDAAQILDRLAFQEQLPVDAIRAAAADRAAAVPIFVHAIEQYLSPGGNAAAQDALFFMFHMLGDWREKSAYRPLARLLRRPPDEVDLIFGGAITETTHRVMAAVFDGDPKPLYDVILDPQADEYIRSRMLETIAMVTLSGELPRAEAARFLRSCYAELDPQDECFVWHGWQSAIALLSLAELKPLVARAFARGFISCGWLGFEDFEEDLQHAIDDPARRSQGEFSLFGDTIEELSSWHCFRPKDPKDKERVGTGWGASQTSNGPAINRFKKVGRNDPCPCGSGSKFKKCCLAAQVGLTALQAM